MVEDGEIRSGGGMKCGMNKGGPGGNRTRGSTTRVVNPPRNSAAEPRGPGPPVECVAYYIEIGSNVLSRQDIISIH